MRFHLAGVSWIDAWSCFQGWWIKNYAVTLRFACAALNCPHPILLKFILKITTLKWSFYVRDTYFSYPLRWLAKASVIIRARRSCWFPWKHGLHSCDSLIISLSIWKITGACHIGNERGEIHRHIVIQGESPIHPFADGEDSLKLNPFSNKINTVVSKEFWYFPSMSPLKLYKNMSFISSEWRVMSPHLGWHSWANII